MAVDRENDNDVVDAYLAARPSGELDEDGAQRIGVQRSRFNKLRRARAAGKDVKVHDSTREEIVRATAELESVDPVARARMEGMRQAMAMMRDLVWQLDKATAPIRPPTEEPVSPPAAVPAERWERFPSHPSGGETKPEAPPGKQGGDPHKKQA